MCPSQAHAENIPNRKACVFITSACLKHSRDGKAFVLTTSALLFTSILTASGQVGNVGELPPNHRTCNLVQVANKAPEGGSPLSPRRAECAAGEPSRNVRFAAHQPGQQVAHLSTQSMRPTGQAWRHHAPHGQQDKPGAITFHMAKRTSLCQLWDNRRVLLSRVVASSIASSSAISRMRMNSENHAHRKWIHLHARAAR